MAGDWQQAMFADLLVEPVRNGIYKPKEFHGRGAKIVNMGELFAHPRLRAVPMKRVELSESESERFALKEGDLIFARRSLTAEGAGKCSVVLRIDEPTTFESSIIRARPDRQRAEPLYLYYFFNSAVGFHSLDTIRRQVAVAGITGSDLSRLEIPVPSLPEQRAIGQILGTLDDKIELNRRMSETLEGVARTLFKSWFVDFDPVRAKAEGRDPGLPKSLGALFPDSFEGSQLGDIPKGWGVRTVGATVKLSRDAVDPSDYPTEAFDHFSIPAFDADKVPACDSGDSIKSQKFVVADGCVLVSKLNPATPRVWMTPAASSRRQVASTEFLVCVGDKAKAMSRELIYCLTSSTPFVEYLTTHAAGTSNSHQRVRPQDFLEYEWTQPQAPLCHAFTEFVSPLFGKIGTIRNQSATLAALRDTLLPKLTSGELRVKDAERFIAKAA